MNAKEAWERDRVDKAPELADILSKAACDDAIVLVKSEVRECGLESLSSLVNRLLRRCVHVPSLSQIDAKTSVLA